MSRTALHMFYHLPFTIHQLPFTIHILYILDTPSGTVLTTESQRHKENIISGLNPVPFCFLTPLFFGLRTKPTLEF
jgi:hypothetical protein